MMIRTLALSALLLVAAPVEPAFASARGFFTQGFSPSGGTDFVNTEFAPIQVYSGLPRGSYIAMASAVVLNEDTAFHFVQCVFGVGDNIVGDIASGTVVPDTTITLPLLHGFTIDQREDLSVLCRTDADGLAISGQGTPLAAIRVDRLDQQQ